MGREFAPALVMIVMFLTMGGMVVLRGPLGKALAERLAGRTPVDDGELEQLRAGLDEVRAELTAVQERLDFAERLLARAPGGKLIGPEA